MTEISSTEIAHLSRLARIELTPQEEARFAEQLSSIVGYADQLSEVNTEKIGTVTGVTGMQNVLGADVLRKESDACAVSKEALLAGVPAQTGGYIEVRAVMGEEVVSA